MVSFTIYNVKIFLLHFSKQFFFLHLYPLASIIPSIKLIHTIISAITPIMLVILFLLFGL